MSALLSLYCVPQIMAQTAPLSGESVSANRSAKTREKSKSPITKMALKQAVLCEGISNFKPFNPAVVFSISQGNLFCFTAFDPVYEKTTVYHHWYNRDKLVFSMRLILSTPKWACFSKIQIREADKGPWRVEILNEKKEIIKTLRFSMVD